MKRTILAVFFSLILCLAACSKAGGEVEPPIALQSDLDYDNRFLGPYANITEAEDVYYYSCSKGYLYYYDRASGVGGVLCGKPECIHDSVKRNEGCNGCLDIYLHSLNLIDGRLCYCSYDSTAHCNALFSINTDGTDRRVVCDLEGYDIMSCGTPQRLDYHRGKLYGYGLYQRVTDAEPEKGLSVLCIDPKTGEAQVIHDFRGNYNYISFYYFRQYVFFSTSLYNGAEGSNAVIMRWYIDTSELETVFAGNIKTGSAFAISVLSKDRVLIVPSIPNEDYAVTVYEVSDGKLTKSFEFESWGAAYFIVGAAVCCNPYKDQMEIRTFDGNIIYRGDLGADFLNDLEEGKEIDGVFAAYGDTKEMLMSFNLIDSNDPSGEKSTCLVRYDLTQEKPQGELLIYSPWI